uniref:Putative polyprotein n=1 Tax=Moniliophthora roreri TaxID=221103 RepID=A0A0W0F7U9_MONRR
MSSAYHPQSDGATERANWTIVQMLRQCISPNQKDWVSKLPAIEFAINSARSESTGYAPFFLNFGQMPRSMIWTSDLSDEYPSVRVFARQRRLALMSAHDSILESRVKQVRAANRKRRYEPFKEGELVYVSTKNLTFPKGLARKLVPRYIGPYKILRDFGNHSFKIDLPSEYLQKGVHPMFHSSLLRAHVPNDDRRFPGRLPSQLGETPEAEGQWKIEKVISHTGNRDSANFKVRWSSGDKTWLSYSELNELPCLNEYFDLLGISSIAELTRGPKDVPEAEEAEDGIEVGNIQFPFPLNTDPCPFTLTPTPSLSLPLSPTLYHHPLPPLSPSSLSFTSSSSSYTIEYSNMATSSSATMDIDELRFEYLPGHNSSCCIIRRSPQEFEIHGQNIRHVYGASHVRLIIKQAETIKITDGQPPEDVPGYLTFARIVNRHWQNYKIPAYDPKHKLIDGPYALTDNDKPIPPLELFHCEPHQCVEQGEEILLPGYTSVPIEDHKTMTSITLKKALQNERKAEWHCRDRISKRMERNTAKTGALGYIRPVEKAKMEETHRLKSSKSRATRV